MTPDDAIPATQDVAHAQVAPVDVQEAQKTREERWAERIESATWPNGSHPSPRAAKIVAPAVMALADEEVLAAITVARQDMAQCVAERDQARAEVERTKRGARELGRILDRTLRDALDASGRHDAIEEDGDGDWAVVWETLAELRPRAEAAEAERDQARAEVERLTSGINAAQMRLWGIEEAISDECDPLDPSGVCHGFDLTDAGDCALHADVLRVSRDLRSLAAEPTPPAAPHAEDGA